MRNKLASIIQAWHGSSVTGPDPSPDSLRSQSSDRWEHGTAACVQLVRACMPRSAVCSALTARQGGSVRPGTPWLCAGCRPAGGASCCGEGSSAMLSCWSKWRRSAWGWRTRWFNAQVGMEGGGSAAGAGAPRGLLAAASHAMSPGAIMPAARCSQARFLPTVRLCMHPQPAQQPPLRGGSSLTQTRVPTVAAAGCRRGRPVHQPSARAGQQHRGDPAATPEPRAAHLTAPGPIPTAAG